MCVCVSSPAFTSDFEYLCGAYMAFLSGDDDEYDQLCDDYQLMHNAKVDAAKASNATLQDEVEGLHEQVSNVKCHFSTIVTIIMRQFEDICHNSMRKYVNVVSTSVYHGSNVIFLGVLLNPVVTAEDT